MIEIWKDIPDLSGYQASNLGNIKSCPKKTKNQYSYTETILKQSIDKDGYKIVHINKKNYRVHRLIAKTFIVNQQNKQQVNHINCNKQDNRVENLEWVTPSENIKHAYDNNLININNIKKAHYKKIKAIKNNQTLYFYSIKEASKKLNILKTSISNCLKGRSKTSCGYEWKYDEDTIEFIESEHIYIVNGIIVKSVTQILNELFPNKYKNVPLKILNDKSLYGVKVHKAVEDLENGVYVEKPQSVYICESINQYDKLKKKYNIKVLEQEKIIAYKNIFAGRFDMIAEINGFNCLCDIKTTAEVDKEYLSWQLSMYELAYGSKFDKLYCIWLPKGGLGKLIEIDRIEEVEEKLKEKGIGE